MFRKTITNLKEYQSQKAALLYFQGPHMVKLLEWDDATQTLMMEDLGNHTLKDLFPDEDERAIRITCQLITQLQSHPIGINEFLHLSDWCACLSKPYNLPQDLLDQANTLAQELSATTKQEVLLHGDLHHSNIMLQGDQAIAIDPKPIWGDPLFEPARFILNPIDSILDQPNVKAIIQNRLAIFSEFFNDKNGRIKNWTFVCAMIAACWNIDDGYSPEQWILLANHIL